MSWTRRMPLFVALLVCAMLAACGPSRSDLEADLDRFAVPADWRHAGTVTRGGIGCFASFPCPVATGYYVVAGEPAEVYAQAAQMLVAAGFTIESPTRDPCDLLAGGSLCSTFAHAGDRRVGLQVWSRDHNFSEVDIQDRSGPIVSLSIWRRD